MEDFDKMKLNPKKEQHITYYFRSVKLKNQIIRYDTGGI